ncbi:MAG: RNA polymerase sigma-70 factor (ECF subfamily) [Candidatus Promineifilaceae bacterium]|jgi:RNA polymerase sigma-70 factor (ECF subfamily)
MQETFETLRNYLFAIAYRMLGSVMEAEDMVQEAWLRWDRSDQSAVQSPKAFLAKTITRLCLDQLKSAQTKREHYVGEWLPEPILTTSSSNLADWAEPEQVVELADSLSIAFLHMLERLNPAERAVFLLREVFDYDYPAIAEIVDKNEAACRQLLRRAKTNVADNRPKFDTTLAEHEQILASFASACFSGSMDDLLTILADGVTSYSDGGGIRKAALKPIIGAKQVARFMLGLVKQVPAGAVPSFDWLNGQPAIIILIDGEPYAALSFHIENGKIMQIYNQFNPHKLKQVASKK